MVLLSLQVDIEAGLSAISALVRFRQPAIVFDRR